MLSRFSWLAVLGAAVVRADEVLPNLSFAAPFSDIPNHIDRFSIVSSGSNVQVHSDRIILTPPYYGNARGAIWSDQKTSAYDWEAELVFRANGPNSPSSGNLQLWAVDDTSVGANSVYTVSKFDGLVIVVDQYGGGGGKIRGFLNDGSKVYSIVPNLESLAFGHCNYSYRNRGSTSTLKITNRKGLTVSIDGTQCFHTDKIALPVGQHFGISAATSDNPDSFEISSFTVRSLGAVTGTNQLSSNGFATRDDQTGHNSHVPAEPQWHNFADPSTGNTDPDQDPTQVVDHQRQFNDLHTRLQHMAHTLASISRVLLEEEERSHERQEALMKNVALVTDLDPIRRLINELLTKVGNLEKTSRDYTRRRGDSTSSMATLSLAQIEEIKKAAKHASPSLLSLALTMMAVQVVLVGAFAVCTGRSSRPKKYL